MHRETIGDYSPSAPTPLSDRLPPQNIEAEEGVIGSVLLDNGVLHEVVARLKADDFYRDTHQIIYRGIRKLYDEGKEIDAITLADDLDRRGELKAIGGDETLFNLLHRVPHAANANYYAAIVWEKAIARRLIEISTETLREAYSNKFTAEQLLQNAEKRIFDLAAGQTSGTCRTIGEILVGVMETIQRRVEQKQLPGISSGWRKLDFVTGGFQPQQLIVLAARPSLGKSAMSWNIADHAAVELGLPVMYVSLEMDGDSLGERALSARGMVEGNRIKTGYGLNGDDLFRIARASGQLAPAKIHVEEAASMTILQIVSRARQIKVKDGLGLIVVDYLQLIAPEDERESRQEQVAKISRRLKALARELRVPVIALSQLNRKVEDRDDHRPRMSDVRESGQVEADADVVMLLHRPDYYDPNDQPGIAELIIAKNRNGATGSIELVFQGQYTRFDAMARPGDHDAPPTTRPEDAPFAPRTAEPF